MFKECPRIFSKKLSDSCLRLFKTDTTTKYVEAGFTGLQCWGSADPYLRLTNPDPDPDPVISSVTFNMATKKIF
jgi:hypothetical protein